MNKIIIALVMLVAILVALFFIFDLGRFLTLEALKATVSHSRTFTPATGWRRWRRFMAVYIVQTALSLPGAAILSLAAGAIFGAVMGTVYANIAATIGATLAFLVDPLSSPRYGDAEIRRQTGKDEQGTGEAGPQLPPLPAAGADLSLFPHQPGRRAHAPAAAHLRDRHHARDHPGRFCLLQRRGKPGHDNDSRGSRLSHGYSAHSPCSGSLRWCRLFTAK